MPPTPESNTAIYPFLSGTGTPAFLQILSVSDLLRVFPLSLFDLVCHIDRQRDRQHQCQHICHRLDRRNTHSTHKNRHRIEDRQEAAKSVIAWKNRSDIAVGDTEEMRYIKHYNDLAEEFKTFQEQQMNFNKELIQEIRNQQEYIEQRLEQRDRLLIQSLRETLKVRKEIVTAEKKWWQFWK